MYIIWSILFIVYLILVVVTAFITIALTYFQVRMRGVCVVGGGACGAQAAWRLHMQAHTGIRGPRVLPAARRRGHGAMCHSAHACAHSHARTRARAALPQLAVEDHYWWWRSFLCGGSTGFFVYAYCFYYYMARSNMTGFMQVRG